jgi:hypothetical protein
VIGNSRIVVDWQGRSRIGDFIPKLVVKPDSDLGITAPQSHQASAA